MEKEKIIKYLEDLNKFHIINITNTDKKRLIFDNGNTFKIYGEMDKGVLIPFNDYTYNWLNSFLSSVINLLGYEDLNDLDALNDRVQDLISEWADSETDVYTSGLSDWLSDNVNNSYYLDEAHKNNSEAENILMIAQYTAIEEFFNNALSIMIEDLKQNFEED